MARLRIDLPANNIATLYIPVRITDINYGNHLGNDSLVGILHEARMQFLQLYNYTEISVAGTSLIMSELAVEYKSEAFFNDMIEVKVFTGDILRVSFELFYSLRVKRSDATITIANAKTGMVCYNYSTKKVEAVPDELKKILTVSQ